MVPGNGDAAAKALARGARRGQIADGPLPQPSNAPKTSIAGYEVWIAALD